MKKDSIQKAQSKTMVNVHNYFKQGSERSSKDLTEEQSPSVDERNSPRRNLD
jgi:hypothetical protein